MIKQLVFTAALLASGAAYAANPSATFSDQVIPAGSNRISCGSSPLGDAAADVAAVGFTTCALYSDFTTPIPNTVGTGLTDGWLNCNQTDTPTATWYWGQYPMFWTGSGRQLGPCVSGPTANSSNSDVFQTTDPVNGGTVLEFQALAAGCVSAFGGQSFGTLPTPMTNGPETPSLNNPGLYPYSYVEEEVRSDNPINSPAYDAMALSGWGTPSIQIYLN
jgi:hypothetical protein